jgi:hypothetical protein
MSPLEFALFLVVGSAALASWVDTRIVRLRPGSPFACVMHGIAGCVVLRITGAFATGVAGSSGSGARTLAVLFLIVLPGFVYAFLGWLWLARTLAEVARLSGR